MLRLQKERNKDISVSLRTRERLLSRTFIYALGIAVGMHLFAALIFQIHAYFNTDTGIAPPISVQADLGNLLGDGDSAIVANLDELENIHGYLLAPVPSSPDIPHLGATSAESQIEYVKEDSFTNNPFTNIEEDWSYLLPNKQNPKPPRSIQVHISGELSEIRLIENGVQQAMKELTLPRTKSPSTVQVSFEVQVEGKTGRIFWQTGKSTNDQPAVLAATAERVLSGMRFQPNEEIFVSSGEVEIVFVGI